MALTINTISLTFSPGDNVWDLLKKNQEGLRYTETELDKNPELFVWIAFMNAITNFRNIEPSRLATANTIVLPSHDSFANVVTTVRTDTNTYKPKYFEWVDMDRCARHFTTGGSTT